MIFSDFKGMIFDLDGTLIDSNHVWSDIDIKFLAKRGFEVPSGYFKTVSTMNFNQAAIYTNDFFKLNEKIDDIVQEWYDMALYEYSNNIRIKNDVDVFLKKLKDRDMKIALATASAKELYEAVLQNNDIYDYFDFFASTDQVKLGKGFPDVYEFACKGLELKPDECAVFEDIIEGIRGAKLGGFTAVACLNDRFIDDWGAMKTESDYYFENYSQLTI